MANAIGTEQIKAEENAFLPLDGLVVEQLPSHLLEKIASYEESTGNLKDQKVSVLQEIDVKLTHSLCSSNIVRFTVYAACFSLIVFLGFSISVIISNPVVSLLLFSGVVLLMLQPVLHRLFHEYSLSAPSSLGPLEFLNVKEAYYKKMEKALSLSLNRLSKPTEEESQKLLNNIYSIIHRDDPIMVFSNKDHFDCSNHPKSGDMKELLSFFKFLSKTKTGYFVLNQALQSNELIILNENNQSKCSSSNHRSGGAIKWIFSKIFSSIFIFDWKIRHSKLKFSEYIPEFEHRNFTIHIANPTEILCMEDDGKIVSAKKQTKALTLLHELAHTFSRNRFDKPLQELPLLEQMDGPEEFKAIMFENMLLKELGFTCRRIAHWSPSCWSDALGELQHQGEKIGVKEIGI